MEIYKIECGSCICRNVCKFRDYFQFVQKSVTSMPISYDHGSGVRTARLHDIQWIEDPVLHCKHYIPDPEMADNEENSFGEDLSTDVSGVTIGDFSKRMTKLRSDMLDACYYGFTKAMQGAPNEEDNNE